MMTQNNPSTPRADADVECIMCGVVELRENWPIPYGRGYLYAGVCWGCRGGA